MALGIQIWLGIAAILVVGMQIGFLFLEAGFVRSKNSINVSIKNVADFAIAVLAFHVIGAAIMFGEGIGVAGFDPGLMVYSGSADVTLYLLFQAMFCGTAATIVSGAVAERIRFNAYLLLTLPLTVLVYPVVGHWTWAGLLPGGSGQGWLEALGYIDFAGSSVVHLTGGAASLAVLLVIGARTGRFGSDDETLRAIHGHSPVLAGGGVLILLVCWLGFNTGTLEPGSLEFAKALSNTVFAGSAACMAAGLFAYRRDGYYRADRMINGMLVGLVAITASAPFAYGIGALAIGVVSGVGSVVFADWMENSRKIDDAVYAVSVHGLGGAMGTLAVPFIVPSATLTHPVLVQFGVQLLGVVCIGGLTFLVMTYAARVMHARGQLRVTIEEEDRGLNLTEHRAMLGNAELTRTLVEINAGVADLGTRIEIDPFEEGGEIAAALNAFLDRVEETERRAAEQLRAERGEIENLAERERQRANASEALLQEFQEQFGELVQQLKAQARDLSSGSKSLAERSAHSGQLVEQASEQAHSTVAMAEQMAQGAHLLARTLELVGQRVEGASAAAATADNACDKGSEIAGTLEASTREIGKLVALIQAISDKTKMLALNAKIEAARAGHAGRGFAVVSDEVSQLAQQSEQATREIGRIVGSLTQLIGNSIAQFRAIDTSMETVRAIADEAVRSLSDQRSTSSELDALIRSARDGAMASGNAVARVSENFAGVSPTIARIDESSAELEQLASRIDSEVLALRQRFASLGTAA